MEVHNVEIKTELLVVFNNKAEWINKAAKKLGNFPNSEKIICIDKNGNAVTCGYDFKIAEDDSLFPVTGYRIIRNSEAAGKPYPHNIID